MMPPRPYGSTTVRIIPHRVPPSASAASFSPGGVCENTSRTTAVTIGSTISDTTMPAMKIDPVRGVRVGLEERDERRSGR